MDNLSMIPVTLVQIRRVTSTVSMVELGENVKEGQFRRFVSFAETVLSSFFVWERKRLSQFVIFSQAVILKCHFGQQNLQNTD